MGLKNQKHAITAVSTGRGRKTWRAGQKKETTIPITSLESTMEGCKYPQTSYSLLRGKKSLKGEKCPKSVAYVDIQNKHSDLIFRKVNEKGKRLCWEVGHCGQ